MTQVIMREKIKNPTITCLMCVFNGEKFLNEAIDSILQQTFSDFEFIIIDDASTDSTVSILKSFSDARIRVVQNEQNLGLTKSLNKGIALAKGTYLARMDADDISLPQRFQKQIMYFKNNAQVAIIASQGKDFIQRKWPLFPKFHNEIKIRLLFENPLVHSSIMVDLQKVGTDLYYNEKYITTQDYELWCRLIQKFTFFNLSEKLILFRKHEHQLSKTKSTQQKQNVLKVQEMYAKSIGLQLSAENWTILRRMANYNEPVNQFLQIESEKVLQNLEIQLSMFSVNWQEIILSECKQWWMSLLERGEKNKLALTKKWYFSRYRSIKYFIQSSYL